MTNFQLVQDAGDLLDTAEAKLRLAGEIDLAENTKTLKRELYAASEKHWSDNLADPDLEVA